MDHNHNDNDRKQAPTKPEAMVADPGVRFWKITLWIVIIGAGLWLGARVLTPKLNAEVATPAALAEQLPREGLALVTFGADWCGACRTLKPEVERFAGEQPEVTVLAIDIDQQRALADHYEIRSIPVMLVFRDGVLIDHHVGIKRGQRLNDWVLASR